MAVFPRQFLKPKSKLCFTEVSRASPPPPLYASANRRQFWADRRARSNDSLGSLGHTPGMNEEKWKPPLKTLCKNQKIGNACLHSRASILKPKSYRHGLQLFSKFSASSLSRRMASSNSAGDTRSLNTKSCATNCKFACSRLASHLLFS